MDLGSYRVTLYREVCWEIWVEPGLNLGQTWVKLFWIVFAR